MFFCKNAWRFIILFAFLMNFFIMPALTQNHQTYDNYTGNWENTGAWTIGDGNLSENDLVAIYGFIQRNSNLTLSKGANLNIYDTLIIHGNLLIDSNAYINVQSSGILIVYGNMDASWNATLDLSGYCVIVGDFSQDTNSTVMAAPGDTLLYLTGTMNCDPLIATCINSNLVGTEDNLFDNPDLATLMLATSSVIFPSNPGFCSGGGSVTLSVSSQAVNCQWYFNGASIPGGTGYFYSANQAGSYDIGFDLNGVTYAYSDDPPFVDVTSKPVPSITNTFPATRCGSGVLGLGAEGSAGIISWYDIPVGGSAVDTGIAFTTPVLSSTTTYYVDITDDGCTSTPRTSVTATINPLPAVSFAGLDSVYDIQLDGIVALTGNPADAGGTFSGAGITDNGNGTATFNPATAGLGVHTIIYSYTDINLCTNADTQYVDIRDYNTRAGARLIPDINNWCSSDAQFSTVGATADGPAGSCWNTSPNYNRWFKFQATTNMVNITVRRGGTLGTIRRINAAIWQSDASTQVACNIYVNDNDDVTVGAVNLIPGNWYYISVDNNYAGYRGTFSLCVDDAVDYDFYEGAQLISNTSEWSSAAAAYTTLGATRDKNAAPCWNTSPDYNRWFKFQAATSMINIVVRRGGTFGTVRRINAALWQADGTTQVKCNRYVNDDDSVVVGATGLTPGNWYYFSVDNNYAGYRGTFSLHVKNTVDYDYYEGAYPITTIRNWCSADAQFSTLGATPDKSAASCWNTAPDYNRWFRFTATTPVINVEVKRGGSFGTIRRINAAIFQSDGTTLVSCNRYVNDDDNVIVGATNLVPGNTYYIAVDNNYAGYRGSFTLCTDDQLDYNYFEGAEDVTPLINSCSASAAYTTIGATADRTAPSCWNTAPDYNRWFKFLATKPAIKVEIKRGGSYGTIRRINLALYDRDSTTVLACNRYVNDNDNVSVSYEGLTVGQWYFFAVDNNYAGYRGSFTVCLDDATSYDYYEGAILLGIIDNWSSVDAAYTTIGATRDRNTASCWNTGPDYNRWFKFYATGNEISFQIKRGGTYGTVQRINAAIWQADGTTEVECRRYVNDGDNVILESVNLIPGNLYYVSIDNNYAGYRGSFSLYVDNEVGYDFYEGAEDVTGIINSRSGLQQYSTIGATRDRNAGSCWNTGPDYNRWFKFQATTPGISVQVLRGGSYGTIRRTNLAIWEADGTTQLACNRYVNDDDIVEVSHEGLTPGNWYYISVDNNYAGYRGTFTLQLNDSVSYDYYEGAYNLPDIHNWCSSDALYTTIGATRDKNAAPCWNTSPDYNRWFKFTASTPVVDITIKRGGTQGSVQRINVALWQSDGTTPVACNRYVNDNDIVSVNATGLTPGNVYYISVDNNYAGYRGTFTLCVNDEVDYDYYEGAITLANLNNWTSANATYTTIGATPDKNAASCWNTSPNYNRWFKFQAINPDVSVQVLRGGAYGTIQRINLALWQSNGTSQLACSRYTNDQDNVTVTYAGLTPGNWYYISVDNNYAGYRGTFTLRINNVSSNVYYAIADGNWNDPNSWSLSEGGPPAGSTPGLANVAYIKGFDITVTGNESCAELNIQAINDVTSLTIDGGSLSVHGSLNYSNNGANVTGLLSVVNAGNLAVTENFNMLRAGGNTTFDLSLGSNATVSITGNLNLSSTGGTTIQSQLLLTNNAQLSITGNGNLSQTSGPKLFIQLNNNAILNLSNNLTIQASAQNLIEVETNNDSRINLGGSITRSAPAYGILDCNDSSILALNSSNNIQTLPGDAGAGTDNFSYNNLIINNSRIASPQIILGGSVTIPGTLTLTDGIIQTTTSNLLSLTATSTVVGGSTASYISGPLKKAGNTAFSFPVGKAGLYNPVSISAPALISDAFTAEYFNDDPGTTYSPASIEASIDHIARCEYWQVDRTSGTSAVAVTLSWNGSTCCINNLSDLKVAAWNGSLWADMGNASTTGNTSAGTITSSSTLSNVLNPVTFGNNLPVTSFTGLAGPYCNDETPIMLTGSPQDANGNFSGEGITDNHDGTAAFNPVAAGSGIYNIQYTYTGTSGCSNSDLQTVTVLPSPASSFTGTATICKNTPTPLDIYFTGTAPWIVSYTNGTDTTDLVTSDNPYHFETSDTGVYKVIAISDSYGCHGTNFGDSAIITSYNIPVKAGISVVTGDTLLCDGESVTLQATAADYYYWSNSVSTQLNTIDEAGSYTVRVFNSYGCMSEVSDPLTVTVFPLPTPTITGSINVNLNDEVTYTTQAGKSNYMWGVSAGGTIIAGGGGSDNTATIRWTSGGSQSVNVNYENTNGCDAILPTILNVYVFGFGVSIVSVSDESCPGSNDGEIIVSASGGTLPYEYSIDGGVSYQSADIFSGLSVGSYTIIARDANLLTATVSTNVGSSIAMVVSALITNVDCYGESTGGINLSVGGGTSPYTYLWSSGETNEDLYGIPASTYGVTITDDNSCTATGSYTVNESPEITIDSETATDVSCYGAVDGTISVAASGGTGALSYSIDNGSTWHASGDFGSLLPGVYIVQVTDVNSCGPVSSSTLPIDDGPELIIDLGPDQETCEDAGVVLDAGPGYDSYLWSTGGTNQTETIINSGDITSVETVSVTVTVTDINGCSGTSAPVTISIYPIPSTGSLYHIPSDYAY
jgi:hypothetical protein